jgi:sulfite reductase alpha subunit-like flavoprotein
MASLVTGDSLKVDFSKGTLLLPSDKDIPLICIGPGTGVAPMRSLLIEKLATTKTGIEYFNQKTV